MAVEATHLNLFPSHLIQDRDVMNSCNQANVTNPYQQIPLPALGNQSFYQLPAVCDSLLAKTSVNTDSGLTYNNIPAPPRKRLRESTNQLYATPNIHNSITQHFPSFVGEDILSQIKQHQFEIDAIISHHNKKIRLVLEERQKQHAILLTAAIEQGVVKKLKEKDEQIQKMGRLNLILQERVKSLYVENQLWRDLAQSNEATANSLRSDLEQVLAASAGTALVEEDVESCCGSSDNGKNAGDCKDDCEESRDKKWCRGCGERESCVLLLPCRHMCLCNVCGSSTASHQLQKCPICHATLTATLHVNLSS